MGKHIAIVDPFPRTLELIFSKDKFRILKSKYQLLYAPKNKKNFFYEKNIHKASFIIGQPDLPKNLLIKAKKLKAIINVESNFINNMDYQYCFKKEFTLLQLLLFFQNQLQKLLLG